MIKKFNIRLYSFTGNFKRQITDFGGKVQWSENINGGQGDLYMDVLDTSDMVQGDIIEITESSDTDKSIKPSYTGIIEYIEDEHSSDGKTYSVQVFGLFTVLNKIIFQQGSLKEFSIEDTPGNIAKDIIDYFNTLYGSISSDTNNISGYLVRYTSESIDITGDTINIDFSDESCFSALGKCIEVTPFRFYISEEGIVYFQKKENSKKVKATYGKDLVSIKKRKSKTDIVNRLYLSNGTLEQTYNKASSQALYPLSEKVIKKTYLNDLDTMDQYAENYLEIYGEVVPEITVEILTRNSNEIKPLDIFSTENSLDVVEDIEIIKIDKKLDRYILYLGSYTSLGDFFIE